MKLLTKTAALAATKLLAVSCAIAVVAVAPSNAAVLVGLYTFNNAAALGQDSSGNGNTLLAYGGGATYTANGASGGGLVLDGNSYLSTASQSVPGLFPTGNSAYTLSVTFKTTSSNSQGLIGWGAYGNTNQTNALRTNGGAGIYEYWWANDIYGSATVNDGQFHTVTSSYDGTTRNLYFDGNLLNSDQPGAANVQSGNFAIGLTNAFNGSPYTANEHFIGTLDNVAIFNQAETPQQVSAAIAAASAVPEPATWGLMLGGFGLIGAAMRRQRRAPAFG